MTSTRRLALIAAALLLPATVQAQSTGPWGVAMPFAAPQPIVIQPTNPYSVPPAPYAPLGPTWSAPRPSSINDSCLFRLDC